MNSRNANPPETTVVIGAPLNVAARSEDELGRALSTFAHTPFTLDGVTYASIEGFYASLKFTDPAERSVAASLSGKDARKMAQQSRATSTEYEGTRILF